MSEVLRHLLSRHIWQRYHVTTGDIAPSTALRLAVESSSQSYAEKLTILSLTKGVIYQNLNPGTNPPPPKTTPKAKQAIANLALQYASIALMKIYGTLPTLMANCLSTLSFIITGNSTVMKKYTLKIS